MKQLKRWSTRPLFRGALVAIAFFGSIGGLFAYRSYQDAFLSHYPQTTIRDYTDWSTGDECKLCHVPSGRSKNGNAYLWDMHDTHRDYNLLDTWDSDGDGIDNRTEANTLRVHAPLDIGGTQQVGYNPGLIDCPDGRLGYDPQYMELVTNVHETPPQGTIWSNEVPGINCNDDLDNDCDGQKDADDPDCSAPLCTSDDQCDDGLFCNGQESCDPSSGCRPATSLPCAGSMCDESADSCADCLSNSNCDDGFYCNGSETCAGGVCVAGAAVQCNDGVSCTEDSCNESTNRCDHVSVDSFCDDGSFCNGVESCDPSAGCRPAGETPCAGLTCNESADRCEGCLSAADCDDGNACNGEESCDAGTCRDGVPPVCDDGLFCNGSESCDPQQGCRPASSAPCGGGACDESADECVSNGNVLVFQNDGNYSGTEDAIIRESAPDLNDGASDVFEWDLADAGGMNRGLLRFGGIVGDRADQIPRGAQIVSALLELVVLDPSAEPAGEIYLASEPWTQAQATWNNFGGRPENSGDVIAAAPVTVGPHVIDVRTAVQVWANNPAQNYGLFFVARSTNGVEVFSSEHAVVAERPKLTVEYALTGCGTHADCDDGVYCNGEETCQAGACHSGSPVSCGDGDVCTDDSCVEASRECRNVFDPTNASSCDTPCPDLDLDGYSTSGGSCGSVDCNDEDPAIHPNAPELCADGRDSDCDGQQDDAVCDDYDADGDGRVDGKDLAWIGRAFGMCSSTPLGQWWYPVDADGDGCITGNDLALFSTAWNCTGHEGLCP